MSMTGAIARALRHEIGASTWAVFRTRWRDLTDDQQAEYLARIGVTR